MTMMMIINKWKSRYNIIADGIAELFNIASIPRFYLRIDTARARFGGRTPV